MAQRGEENRAPGPVRYPTRPSSQPSTRRTEPEAPSRWIETGQPETAPLQRRLLWLLLAVEVGMALAAACVLPLAFLDLPIQEKGLVVAILERMGESQGSSSVIICLGLILPLPSLLLGVVFCLWLFRRFRHTGES